VMASDVQDALQADRLREVGVRTVLGPYAGERLAALELEAAAAR
jgi:hypothetical protein